MNKKPLKLTIDPGVAALLLAAHRTSPLNGDRYPFKGDLKQMSAALEAAQKLGLECDVERGIPFVTSQDALDTLVKYLYDNKIPGYHNYPVPKESQ